MNLAQNIFSQLNTAICAKDLTHRIIYCNERFAQNAGQDSAQACIDKTDEHFIWKKYSHLYKSGDIKAMQGVSLCNVLEPQAQPNGETIVLLNKHPMIDERGKIVGIIASVVNVDDLKISKKEQAENQSDEGFSLGEYFDHAVLAPREFQILKQILTGHTAKKIATDLCISQKTVETYVARIKIKMQCKTKGDIIYQSVVSGLYHKFFINE